MIGSLFSGIGGLERGLERAGLGPVAWQVEIDPFCRAVLAEHWPSATRYADVRAVSNLPAVDIICGGFPCQDVSAAGLGAGIEGARSGLWREFRRLVEDIAPRLVVVENVASGKRRWLPTVRRDLYMLGYRSAAVEVSAFDVGAPHRRARVFVVASHAYCDAVWLDEQRFAARREGNGQPGNAGDSGSAANAVRARRQPRRVEPGDRPEKRQAADRGDRRSDPGPSADADGRAQLQPDEGDRRSPWTWARTGGGTGWTALAPVRGVAHGVPRRLDRLRSLGNAVVPQCAEAIGRLIVAGLAEVAA